MSLVTKVVRPVTIKLKMTVYHAIKTLFFRIKNVYHVIKIVSPVLIKQIRVVWVVPKGDIWILLKNVVYAIPIV